MDGKGVLTHYRSTARSRWKPTQDPCSGRVLTAQRWEITHLSTRGSPPPSGELLLLWVLPPQWMLSWLEMAALIRVSKQNFLHEFLNMEQEHEPGVLNNFAKNKETRTCRPPWKVNCTPTWFRGWLCGPGTLPKSLWSSLLWFQPTQILPLLTACCHVGRACF